ncbi:Uncharacterised protein [Acinetobacter baumannii]|nr:Uncharacterised protein [Acinetobacter baumannii]
MAKPLCLKTLTSTTGCLSVSSHIRNTTKPMAAVKAKTTMLVLLNQSRSCPKSSISCNAPIHRINSPKPTVSILKEMVSVSATLNKRIAANTQTIPTGKLIKKIQCQDRLSLIRPPKIGPKIGPTTVVIAHRPIACACFS